MFDPETVLLMNNAPALEGLENGRIPQIITEAYAEIVATRIRMRELQAKGGEEFEVPRVIEKMRNLAFTQEALVASSANRENRAAAAFVAGSAHHACLLAESLLTSRQRDSILSFDGISPEVSATVLFLGAEASADAAEVSKFIRLEGTDILEGKMLYAIKCFASGNLQALLRIELMSVDQILGDGGQAAATRALYHKLLEALIKAAAILLDAKVDFPLSEIDPLTVFEEVQKLSIEPTLYNLTSEGSVHQSVYPGPLHLASLLSGTLKDFLSNGVVSLLPPDGVDGASWSEMMRSFAKRRPFLWRNHRQAISSGYLNVGTSSAVSFPTGAGKSTLAELKIATTIIRGKKIVFLAPTLALVDQTTRALNDTFPDVEVFRERSADVSLEIADQELPAISVMTPERCLALLNFAPDLFGEVELVVFDECHLLHPRSEDRSRRAVDAMMCILNLSVASPTSDLLFLSAMMKNSSEIASWLQELTGRSCLPLDLPWKPTRQVRGCIVYSDADVKALKAKLSAARQNSENKNTPKATKDGLRIEPYGFFCLNQTWNTKSRRDYSLLKLLDEEVLLSTGTQLAEGAPHKDARWYLTPNGVQVSQKLAEEISKKNLKTIVFMQTIPWAISANNKISENTVGPGCILSETERANYVAALDELGDAGHLYVKIDGVTNSVTSSSACHHGHLLPFERALHESLFKRDDGINVLVATSTLSQGMNLPGDVVIIGGDSRFDLDADKMTRVEAHELLNAAGRAGRAGERSHGFVIIVPSKVVSFDDENSTIHQHWNELQAIFSQGDQCLTLEDPLEPLLDRIHENSAADDQMTEYLIGRLPLDDEGAEGTANKTSLMISRSFAAYKRRKGGDANWVTSRVEAVRTARRHMADESAANRWQDRLAASLGVPPLFVRDLANAFNNGFNADASVADWKVWYVEWLSQRKHLLPKLIRPETLEGFLGTPYKKLSTDEDRGELVASKVFKLLDLWMSGKELRDIELEIGTETHVLKTCERARDFVLDIVPELSYLFGMPSLVIQTMIIEEECDGMLPLALSLMATCVKEGFDTLEKAVLRSSFDGLVNRRSVHREFDSLAKHLPEAAGPEEFTDVLSRLDTAKVIRSFV